MDIQSILALWGIKYTMKSPWWRVLQQTIGEEREEANVQRQQH